MEEHGEVHHRGTEEDSFSFTAELFPPMPAEVLLQVCVGTLETHHPGIVRRECRSFGAPDMESGAMEARGAVTGVLPATIHHSLE